MSRIAGWAHSRFGKLEGVSLYDLIEKASNEALAHAGVDAADVDDVFVAHFNQRMVGQGFSGALPATFAPGLRSKPSVRVEAACASGSAAVHLASRMINSGATRVALVIGVEKMTDADAETVRQALLSASYYETERNSSFAGLFAEFAKAYFAANGDQSAALAKIAEKNHGYGAKNPLAHMQKALSFEFCNTVGCRIRWWPRRSGAPIARWSPTARRPWC